MKFLVVFSCILAVALAKPGLLAGLPIATAILPGAPIGPDGRVVDTPDVALAKASHAAAHINERLNLNREALRSADFIVPAPAAAAAPVAAVAAPLTYSAPAALPIAAPAALPIAAPAATYLAADARPLDTPEVAIAKASHAAAHLNDRLIHASEANRNFLASAGYYL